MCQYNQCNDFFYERNLESRFFVMCNAHFFLEVNIHSFYYVVCVLMASVESLRAISLTGSIESDIFF